LPDKVLERLHTTLGEYELYHSGHMQPRQVHTQTIRAWVSCINFKLMLSQLRVKGPSILEHKYAVPKMSVGMQNRLTWRLQMQEARLRVQVEMKRRLGSETRWRHIRNSSSSVSLANRRIATQPDNEPMHRLLSHIAYCTNDDKYNGGFI
jgi:hypothetical protein